MNGEEVPVVRLEISSVSHPFWTGKMRELGRALGTFVRKLGAMSRTKATGWLQHQASLDAHAAANLASYIAEQKEHTGSLPTDRAITVERFREGAGGAEKMAEVKGYLDPLARGAELLPPSIAARALSAREGGRSEERRGGQECSSRWLGYD